MKIKVYTVKSQDGITLITHKRDYALSYLRAMVLIEEEDVEEDTYSIEIKQEDLESYIGWNRDNLCKGEILSLKKLLKE